MIDLRTIVTEADMRDAGRLGIPIDPPVALENRLRGLAKARAAFQSAGFDVRSAWRPAALTEALFGGLAALPKEHSEGRALDITQGPATPDAVRDALLSSFVNHYINRIAVEGDHCHVILKENLLQAWGGQ